MLVGRPKDVAVEPLHGLKETCFPYIGRSNVTITQPAKEDGIMALSVVKVKNFLKSIEREKRKMPQDFVCMHLNLSELLSFFTYL